MKHNTIWKSIVDLDEWKDYIQEENDNRVADGLDPLEPEDYYERISELLSIYIDDERHNLNIKTNGPIINIADLGLWNGRHSGYKMEGNNISKVLYSDCDDVEWYCDGYDLRATAYHHDGTNYYLYREVKNEDDLPALQKLIWDGTITRKDIVKYTRSLRPYIKEVYGW